MKNPWNMTTTDRLEFYKAEIDRRTPPQSSHDKFMLDIYSKLLEAAEEQARSDNDSGEADSF